MSETKFEKEEYLLPFNKYIVEKKRLPVLIEFNYFSKYFHICK